MNNEQIKQVSAYMAKALSDEDGSLLPINFKNYESYCKAVNEAPLAISDDFYMAVDRLLRGYVESK